MDSHSVDWAVIASLGDFFVVLPPFVGPIAGRAILVDTLASVVAGPLGKP